MTETTRELPRTFSGERKKSNAAVIPLKSPAFPLTLDNLTQILVRRYGKDNVHITENPWLRDFASIHSYDFTILVDRRENGEQIGAYLSRTFQLQPTGGHRNYTGSKQVNRFFYYRAGSDTSYYLKFSDVTSD
ncbi:MAG TPA: hypothetical protein VJK72_02310 [Candidatus Nanoarchaeia archaeon]|nr:hypothetical protein [Candidatus Nanoarchaeia archaeon]